MILISSPGSRPKISWHEKTGSGSVLNESFLPDELPEDVAGQGDILRVEHVDVGGGDGGALVVRDHLVLP